MSALRLDSVRRRLQTVVRGRRGSAQLGLLLAAAAAAGGMTLGSGVAAQTAKSGYDLAWLTDGSRGQLVQVDPVLGRANVRLQVAAPGSTLSIQQRNGQLVVIDRKTGKITSIDLGTMLVGGTRRTTPGAGVKLLLTDSRLYVADLPRGTVQAVDPATQATVGAPWSAGRPLVDIGIDGTDSVWALDSRKTLVNLRWNGTTLSSVATRAVAGAGPGSVIVGHERGVTVFGNQGAIVRVGTGRDGRLDAQNVQGPLHGPQQSPDGLVPVSDPGTSSVVIAGSSDAVVQDVSGYGCARPASPTVFDGRIYVPCTGAQKVLVLDEHGKQVGSAIPVPGGGEPQLTVSGGHLVIDSPGSDRATVVDSSGDTRDFPTVAPGLGVQNPNTPPPDPPTPPTPEPPKHPKGDNGNGHDTPNGNGNGDGQHSGGGPRGPSGSPTSGAPGSDTPAPGGDATATARPDGSVLVSWDAAQGAGATVVTDRTSGDEVASVPAGATSATVTVLAPGTTTSFGVRNARISATTNEVTTSARPGAVAGVTVTPQGVTNGVASLAVTWTAASANGARVSYSVSADGSGTKTTSAVNASIEVPCGNGCTGTVTVTPRNSAGSGTAGSGTYTVSPSTPTQAPDPGPGTGPDPGPGPGSDPGTPSTPPPAPVQAMPAAGQTLITTSAVAGDDNSGNPAVITVTITSPADWASFTGTCTLTEDGADVGSVPCNSQGYSRQFEYYESGLHTYTVVAHGDTATVESAPASRSAVYRQICLNSAGERSLTGGGILTRPICDPAPCSGCQIPWRGQQPEPPSTSVAGIIAESVRRMR